jgi:hypothetical protein
MTKMNDRHVTPKPEEFDGIAAQWHAPSAVLAEDEKPRSLVKSVQSKRSP